MGSTMYGGKCINYHSKDDTIGLDTKVVYSDQNGNEANIDMKKLIELCKRCSKDDFMELFINDIENHELFIGFPVIRALDKVATELGDKEALTCLGAKYG